MPVHEFRSLLRRFFILTTLFLHALSGTADAADLRLRWIHEGATEFIVIVDQPTGPRAEPMAVSWLSPRSNAQGWFEMTVSGIDPAYDADVSVVAIDAAGTMGPPSNVIRLTAAEFCGSVTCDDALRCTHDICGEDFCANTPSNSRCEDLNECTQDFCDLSEGCVHLNTTGTCNDGLDCTVLDSCADGVCSGIEHCPQGTYCSAITGDCELLTTTTSTTSTSTTTTITVFSSTSTTLPVSTTLEATATTSTTTTSSTTVPTVGCGNGVLDEGEECDDGDTIWETGDGCRADCRLVSCGDADGSGSVSLVDALYILYAALGRGDCDPSVCNVDSNLDTITASDALRLLRVIIGVPLELDSPAMQTP